jgi:hypothetical protein
MASQFSREGRDLAKAEGELIDCGYQDPVFYDSVLPPAVDQVCVPGRSDEWLLFDEEERVLATTVGMFAQLKAFSDRKTEVFRLRAR